MLVSKYRLYVSGRFLIGFDNKKDAEDYARHFREVDKSEGRKPRAYTIRQIKDGSK